MMNMKDNLITKNGATENLTYNELSSEFQRLYPSAVRAFELIAHMYNRLTLIKKLSHKVAVAKIYNDHKHLVGFSERNIRRYLPTDNPSVPRRVRSQWPKNNDIEANTPSKLSNTIQGQYEHPAKETDANLAAKPFPQSAECSSCRELSLENRELKEALKKSSKLITADNMTHAAASSINEIHNVSEFEFYLPKKVILDYLGEPYLSLKDGDLKIWFHGKIDRKNGHVISAKLGRIRELQIDGCTRGDET
jgi:hypothetical protein